jgi:hypothetical protein
MKLIAVIALWCTMYSTAVLAQPTPEQLSYFPLHAGNIWGYRVTHQPDQSPEYLLRYETMRITRDTMIANKRYFVVEATHGNIDFGTGLYRMDSLTGSGFCRGYAGGVRCADSLEWEYMTVMPDSVHLTCGHPLDNAWIIGQVPGIPRVGILEVDRPQIKLSGWLGSRTFAKGIGMSSSSHWAIEGAPGTTRRELTYAYINGVEYLPVTFRSFTAAALPGGAVHLRWRTENEVQNAGFTVQRREADHVETWDDLAFVPTRAGEGEGASYEYTDHATTSRTDAVWQYRLRQMDYDGTVAFSDIVTVDIHNIPAAMSLTIWPNPASASVSIHLGLDGDGPALLLVTDMLGREIRRFGNLSPGGVTTWDLHDAAGNRVPAGMYRVTVLRGDRRVSSMVMVVGR